MRKVWQVVIMGCHPTSMLGTKLILEEAGNLIVLGTYSNWEEGAAMVKEEQPELVLLDYCMPDDMIETILPGMKKRLRRPILSL